MSQPQPYSDLDSRSHSRSQSQPSPTTSEPSTQTETTTLSTPSTASTPKDTTTTTPPHPPLLPPLLLLPPELQTQILKTLNWPSLTTLRLTHRHFAHHMMPVHSLADLHATHQHRMHAAELHHLQITLGYSNPNWTGFTQGWGLSPFVSLAGALPCYRCLRWVPAFSSESMPATVPGVGVDCGRECDRREGGGGGGGGGFVREMATGLYDLGMAKARSRVCIECESRCGIYQKDAVSG